MTFPAKLLNEGEHVVVSTCTHPKALLGRVSDELHRLSGGDRRDDGA